MTGQKEKERLIFHIDVNSAFLSWESVYRLRQDPEALDLRPIASAVGGDASTRHGIVLAKSPQKSTAFPPVNLWLRPCANVLTL